MRISGNWIVLRTTNNGEGVINLNTITAIINNPKDGTATIYLTGGSLVTTQESTLELTRFIQNVSIDTTVGTPSINKISIDTNTPTPEAQSL
jgi:hypothetical protein